VHNIYNLIWARTLFEGFNQFRPNRRLFNLTRSGYAGIQRYGVIPWSGDVQRSFGGLAVQLPMVLNMGMSGLAYHNSDIGGFCCGTTTPELYVRWMQYGAFCPITRAHGWGQQTEPWTYGQEAEEIARKYINLRYQLLPYLYTTAFQNYTQGIPLARPLLLEDPNDPRLKNESSTYLLGDNLACITGRAGRTNGEDCLPPSGHMDRLLDRTAVPGRTGCQCTRTATDPAALRQGREHHPHAASNELCNERPLDTLMLKVYPSPEQSRSFTLYEDDGETLEYQSGSLRPH